MFILRSEKLPPPGPAPVMSPDGQHYLSFETLYGKVDTTEKDCPYLLVKNDKNKVTAAKNHKFLNRRVVVFLECSLCGKPRCLFNMNGSLNVKGQQEIENFFLKFFRAVCLFQQIHFTPLGTLVVAQQ